MLRVVAFALFVCALVSVVVAGNSPSSFTSFTSFSSEEPFYTSFTNSLLPIPTSLTSQYSPVSFPPASPYSPVSGSSSPASIVLPVLSGVIGSLLLVL
mmetsp:Transcript_1343/g.1707  ORF Transcript_1343/g.1707 Transcript_1343/m.1707 type:complete len:98 (-) Transcript_1343:107-400(-)